MRLKDDHNYARVIKKSLIEKRLILNMNAGQQEKSQQIEFDIDLNEVQ